MKLNFAKKKLTFAKLEIEKVVKLNFATAEMNLVHAKLILFLAKLSCTLAIFNFVQAELTLISDGEIQMEKV